MHRRTLIGLLGWLACFAVLVAPDLSTAADPSPPTLLGAGASTSNATVYPLGRATLSAGKLYVVFLQLSENGGAVDATPGVQADGMTWTQIDAGQASARTMGLTAYYLAPTADLGNVTLGTGTLSTRHEAIWYSIVEIASEVDPSRPIAQYSAEAKGRGLGYSGTLPTVPAADSLVIAAIAHAADEESSPVTGWEEVIGSDLGHGAPPRGAHVIFDDSDAAATAGSTWASTAKRRGIVIEIPSADPLPPVNAVKLAGAGDICGPQRRCTDTSNRILDADPDVVVTRGDLAYPSGLLSEYRNKYGGGTTPQSRWGRPAIKDITLPGYGNHDCYDIPRSTGATKQGCDDAVAYFGDDSNFGTDIPGTPGSYYTVAGEWLIVQLNSAGQEGSGKATAAELDAQDAALHDILVADQHTCELVIWHHPRYASGGEHGNNEFVDPWFETAYAEGVDVVLNGHDHGYERFAPQDGDGQPTADGVHEFVVGTGGASLSPFDAAQPNSVVRIADRGIITMQLMDDGTYAWAFLDDVTGGVDDSGADACHS